MSEQFTFDPVAVDPGESFKVELDLFGKCASFWLPNEQYASLEYARPNRANGFAPQVTTPGTSGVREPIWPRTLGATVIDGSVTWTMAEAGLNGLNPITSPSAASDPAGLTISNVAVSESTKILATYSGGTLDRHYDAVFTFTLNGVTRVARQRVEFRKR